jgi:hypothetical protein
MFKLMVSMSSLSQRFLTSPLQARIMHIPLGVEHKFRASQRVLTCFHQSRSHCLANLRVDITRIHALRNNSRMRHTEFRVDESLRLNFIIIRQSICASEVSVLELYELVKKT